ncbi:hypothetical protein C8R43DRAFT_1165687 [Mycena crocata]|nr:hypothetical protein C8R43DRAFT_1165687 [Mycena crocata]
MTFHNTPCLLVAAACTPHLALLYVQFLAAIAATVIEEFIIVVIPNPTPTRSHKFNTRMQHRRHARRATTRDRVQTQQATMMPLKASAYIPQWCSSASPWPAPPRKFYSIFGSPANKVTRPSAHQPSCASAAHSATLNILELTRVGVFGSMHSVAGHIHVKIFNLNMALDLNYGTTSGISGESVNTLLFFW